MAPKAPTPKAPKAPPPTASSEDTTASSDDRPQHPHGGHVRRPMSARQVAKRLGRPHSTVLKWITSGRLRADYDISEGWTVDEVTLSNGWTVDSRCYDALQQMMDACRAEGLYPVVCSAYRTQAKQQNIFDQMKQSLLDQGYSDADAETEAGRQVAVPGTSEHQLGLAVDIVDLDHQLLDESQEQTAVQQWLMTNSWRYGFILRYPTAKTETTGIIYEPWHYRYVGQEAAAEIYQQGVCLEEYIAAKYGA